MRGMISFFANLWSSFLLGLATPLTAVCVLPLFPGFIAFLSQKLTGKDTKKSKVLILGLLVAAGVILFMFLIGLLFTTLLQQSLTGVVSIVSPIAFGILALISILLILDAELGTLLPKVKTPTVKNPYLSALVFGFFFGAIVLPCNPSLIAVMFTKSLASSSLGFAANMMSFLSFGIGMAFPLLLFSVISYSASSKIIGFLARHKSIINRAAGIIMLVISMYYLFFVFKIHLLIV